MGVEFHALVHGEKKARFEVFRSKAGKWIVFGERWGVEPFQTLKGARRYVAELLSFTRFKWVRLEMSKARKAG